VTLETITNWIPSSGEISVAGIYIPSLLVYAFVGFALSYGISVSLQRKGWGRYIGHMPLFFVSLWFLVTFSLGLLLYPYGV